jgi:K+-sensing histidine kinase KdpD
MLRRRVARYLVAVLSVALATLGAMPLDPAAVDFPALLLLVAIAISGSFGGYGPAFVAVVGKFQRLNDGGFGTGLGLAIARAATEAQGGRLVVEDSPLGGAQFTILVPTVVTAEVSDAG